MEFGSSVVLALAVALWLAYFVPSWVKRRNYLATEQNAVRMQQALHSLAQTSQSSGAQSVRADSRSVAEHERRVKRARVEAARAEREREAAAKRELPAVRAPRNAEDRKRAASATRRGRLVTTSLTAAGLLASAFGVHLGASTGAWWLLVTGVVVVLAGVAGLQRLARVASAQRAAALSRVSDPAVSARRLRADATIDFSVQDELAAAAAPLASPSLDQQQLPGWVPVPVPKPLYLHRPATMDGETAELTPLTLAASTSPDGPGGPDDDGGKQAKPDHLALLREAARKSEQAIRDAHRQPGIATFSTRVSAAAQTSTTLQTAATRAGLAQTSPELSEAVLEPILVTPVEKRPSRWATMGVLDDIEPGMGDLDAALRRRRVG